MPLPGNVGTTWASHASRDAGWGRSTTDRARLSRSRGPRMTSRSSPSWETMSTTTRSLAVAVVHSTGTDAGSSSSTRAMRR